MTRHTINQCDPQAQRTIHHATTAPGVVPQNAQFENLLVNLNLTNQDHDRFVRNAVQPLDKKHGGDKSRTHQKPAFKDFISNNAAPRSDLHLQITQSLRNHYPASHLISLRAYSLNFRGYCAAGHGTLTSFTDPSIGTGSNISLYFPPASRISGSTGAILEQELFGGYKFAWDGHEAIIYFASWSEGFSTVFNAYILYNEDEEDAVEEMVVKVGFWSQQLRNEVLVFNQGFWQKDTNLWQSVQKANWKDIILPDDFKSGILSDFKAFFEGEEIYKGLGIPWKRGLLFYGPPGNGKTITLRAQMKSLDHQDEPIPSLYVKSFQSWQGPEASIRDIFKRARKEAPCLLILEDLDSLIDDQNRSFFLNELDGLEDNNGILIIGTTNHADRLDPGIIKRPSRFDRKYLFDDPARPERVQYVKYWRNKLEGTKVDFPATLIEELADLFSGFSFAYMKEAFVSTLTYLAARKSDGKGGEDEWLKDFEKVLKKQIAELRKEIDDGKEL